jgi:hypothetical protein
MLQLASDRMSTRLYTGSQPSPFGVMFPIFCCSLFVCSGYLTFGGLLPVPNIQEAATATRVTTRYTISLPFLDFQSRYQLSFNFSLPLPALVLPFSSTSIR